MSEPFPTEFETYAQDFLVCPYCGEVFQDCFELDERGGEYECSECGKEFHYEVCHDVTYSSYRIETEETPNG